MASNDCVICLMPALHPVRLTCSCTMRACAGCLFRWLHPAGSRERACPTCRRKDVEALIINESTGDTQPLNVKEMAARGDRELVELMVNQLGALWFLPDEGGVTPLGAAAAAGHLSVVKLLIEDWLVEVDQLEKGHYETPLFAACLAGKLDVVKYLLEKGADPMACDEYGWYPVAAAAYRGHFEVVKALAESGFVDLNKCVNKEGETAAHEAAQGGYDEIVRYLLEGAANPIPVGTLDASGTSIFHCALTSSAARKKKAVDAKGAAPSAASEGCAAGDDDEEDPRERLPLYLLDTFKEACLPTQRTKHGESALHVAVENGFFSVARRLITAHGLDPQEADEDGNNAAARATAISWRQTDVPRLVEFLRFLHGEGEEEGSRRVDLKATRNDEGLNLLQFGCARFLKVAEFLVDVVGIDPMSAGPDGVTPLYFVIGEGNLDTVLFLESKIVAGRATDESCGDAAVAGGGGSADDTTNTSPSAAPVPVPPSLSTRSLRGYDVVFEQLDGNTLLHQAVSSGSAAMLRHVLSRTKVFHQQGQRLWPHSAARRLRRLCCGYLVGNGVQQRRD